MVSALSAAAEAATPDYEIIIVEDGSTDGTAELASELARRYPRVRVVRQPGNSGYGAAVIRGIAEAKKDYVFYTDADKQYDYGQFLTYWPLSAHYDVVIGYRRRRQDPFTRHIFARGYAFLLKLFFGFRWRDADCSFKFFRRQAIADINLVSRSGFVEAELLLKCFIHGLKIKQVPVRHFARAAGTVSFEVFRSGPLSIVKPRPIWAMFVDMLKCWRSLPSYARDLRYKRLRQEAGL